MMMPNIEPVEVSYTVTPSDATNLPNGICRAILVKVGGDVKVTYRNGTADTLYLAEGIWHPVFAKRIWSTGTTATGIHAGY